MKKLVYTALFIAAGFAASAQVKIGTTPTAIVSGAKLQVDGDATTTTANPSKLIVTSAGYVGIGTSAPSQTLDVVATGGAAVDNVNLTSYSGNSLNPSPVFKALAATGTLASPGFLTTSTGTTGGISNGFSAFNTSAWNGSSFSIVGGMQFAATENHSATGLGTNMFFYTTPNGTTTNVERMRIDQNGNVGIGTISPSYLLDVSGAINGPIITRINNSTTGTGAISELLFTNDVGNSSYIFQVGSAGTGGSGANSMNIVNAAPSGVLALYTQAAERMRITAAGNVGIGTTAPSTLLHVNSGTANASGTAPAFTLSDGSQANGYVLTSNASGGATWKAPNTTVYGTFGANVANLALPAGATNGNNTGTPLLTAASITLPVGKWLVYISCSGVLSSTSSGLTTAGNFAAGGTAANMGSFWLGYSLSDGNTAGVVSATYVDGNIGTNTVKQSLGTGSSFVTPSGVIAINNTSGAAKTFYVYATAATFNNPTSGLYWYSPFASGYGERTLYATPYN